MRTHLSLVSNRKKQIIVPEGANMLAGRGGCQAYGPNI
jgi:hypothetical protein